MNELIDIVYDSIKMLSEISEQNSSRILTRSPFASAFYLRDILSKIDSEHQEQSYPKEDIKKQLLVLIDNEKIKMINTCTPMYLLPENHEKYFVRKEDVIIEFTTEYDRQQICHFFPGSRLIDGKNQLLTPMTSYDFYIFNFKHKELSERVKLIKK